MKSQPSAKRLFQAMDATWAPAEMLEFGPWTLRQGKGGGKRVSAATTESLVTEDDITKAEAAMRDMGQDPIFMIQNDGDALDGMLASLGYRIVDPVLIYVAPAEKIAEVNPAPLDAIPCYGPLALMEELWRQGGIQKPRISVMARTSEPKTYLFGRYNNCPAGAAFVASDKEIAMLHALEISNAFRRFGIGRNILGRAALWALEQDAEYLSVVTTGENLPAQGLFAGLGMQVAGKYHYRMK